MANQQQQYQPYPGAYPQQQYPQQQFVVFNPNQQQGVITQPPTKVKYSEKNIRSVRGLTASQLAIGLVIFVFHAITTAINDHFFNQIAIYKRTPYNIQFGYYEEDFVDHASTGIWIGILVLITASLGLAGARWQQKGLIVAHLVFNVLMLLVLPALIGTVAASISGLNYCRRRGLGGYGYGYDYYDSYGRQSTGKTVMFYGETLYSGSSDSRFHCSAHIFKAWLAMDGIILVAAIFGWLISLTLLVYNCIAACNACCRGCCCCCPTSNSDTNMVAYVAQPQTQATPGFAGQPTYVPPQYTYQPTPLYTGPGTQAPVVTQPAGAPVIVSQPTFRTTGTPGTAVNAQPGGAAAAEDNKWEDLPPEYAEILQNSQNNTTQQQ